MKVKINKPIKVNGPMEKIPIFKVLEDNIDHQIIEADEKNIKILREVTDIESVYEKPKDINIVDDFNDLDDERYYVEVEDKRHKSIGLGFRYKEEKPKNSKFVEIPDNINPLEIFELLF